MPAFTIPKYELVSIAEFIPYSILGVLAAFIAVSFIDILYKAEDLFDAIRIPEWIKPAIGGLIIGGIGIFFPHIFGVGYETMDMSLAGKLSWSFLLFLIFLKIFATAVTIGSGGSGGIFAPSLFLGASLGGFVGNVTHMLIPDHSANSGAYALVGMGAVAAATMHAPMTSILILFELTNDYRIILPLMVTIIISVVLKMNLKKDSIYSLKLARRGLKLKNEHKPNVLSSIKIHKIVQEDPLIVTTDTSFQKLYDLTRHTHHLNYFVVDTNGSFMGILSPFQIRTMEREAQTNRHEKTANDLMISQKVFFTLEDTLDMVGLILDELVLDEIPIVKDMESKEIVGYISKTDVINAYNREMGKKDMLRSVSTYIASSEKFRSLKMNDGNVLCEIELPGTFVGKNLAELDLRHQSGIEVILIKQNYDEKTKESEKVFTPNLSYCFNYGDRLLIVGSQETIDVFNAMN